MMSHYLAVCAIFRDEAPYLAEWIEFHRLQGVEHFYLYDNESSDAPGEILAPYLETGVVTVDWWPGKVRQQAAYEDCLARRRHDARWIAFIDVDEFLWAPGRVLDHKPLRRAMHIVQQTQLPAAVRVPWAMFGPGGHETRPDGLVIDAYLYRQREPDVHFKSIVDPRRTLTYLDPHHFNHGGHPVAVAEFGAMRVNHYWTKSLEECRRKFARGRADLDCSRAGAEYEEIADRLDEHHDPMLALLYGDQLREALA